MATPAPMIMATITATLRLCHVLFVESLILFNGFVVPPNRGGKVVANLAQQGFGFFVHAPQYNRRSGAAHLLAHYLRSGGRSFANGFDHRDDNCPKSQENHRHKQQLHWAWHCVLRIKHW